MKVETNGKSNSPTINCTWKRVSKPNRTRQRMGKYERLLRALLGSVNIYPDGMVTWKPRQLTLREAKELIAIKQAMQKKGGK